MEYRRLGRSGLEVSALSFGSWVTFGQQIDDDVAHACMDAAHKAGVNFFDNAEGYAAGASEEMMGRVIKRAGWKRPDFVVSTKIFWGGQGPNRKGISRKRLLEGTAAALARFQLDHVDLVYCHRPEKETPIEETVRAMSYLVDQGYALYWGTSEWTAPQILEAYYVARREHLVPPTMEQPQYNMFSREKVEAEFARLYDIVGLGTTIFSPLASGLLTGKYNDGIPADSRLAMPSYKWLRDIMEADDWAGKIAKVKELTGIAKELGGTTAQLALAWCLANPHVSSVITGASRPEQVVENMKALDVAAKLTPAVLARIEKILANKPAGEPDY